MLIFQLLKKETAGPYAHLTYPRLHRFFRGESPENVTPVLAGASDGTRPIGAALAVRMGDKAQLLSVYTKPDFRSQGVGTHLVATVEAALRAERVKTITAEYLADKPTTVAFERILAKREWKVPIVRDTVYTFTRTSIGQFGLSEGSVRWPDGATVTRMSDITPEIRAQIEVMQRDVPPSWIASNFNLLRDLEHFDPRLSFLLLLNGLLIGWITMRHITDRSLMIENLFITPFRRGQNLGKFLVWEAARRAYAATDAEQVMCQVLPENTVMLGLLERHYKPIAASVQVTKHAEKQF